jgi:hypothetical protein
VSYTGRCEASPVRGRKKLAEMSTAELQELVRLIPPFAEQEGVLFSPEGQRQAGKAWFAARRGELEQKVCDEWQMCKRIEDPTFEDAAKLVIVVGDAIATIVGGVPPVLVASIIARIGLRTFCHCP